MVRRTGAPAWASMVIAIAGDGIGGGVEAFGHDFGHDHAEGVGGAWFHEARAAAAHRHADAARPPQLAEAGGEPMKVIAQVDGGDVRRFVQMLLNEGDGTNTLAERLEAPAARRRRGAAVETDQAHHHLQVVAHPVIDLGEKGLLLHEGMLGMLLGPLAVRDVEARAEITLKRAVLGEGTGVVQEPAVGTVVTAQAKLDGVGTARGESFLDQGGMTVEIVRVQATPPAMAEFVFAAPAGEIEPALVVMDRRPFDVGTPHHQGHEIREATKLVTRDGLCDARLGRLCLRGHCAPTLPDTRQPTIPIGAGQRIEHDAVPTASVCECT